MLGKVTRFEHRSSELSGSFSFSANSDFSKFVLLLRNRILTQSLGDSCRRVLEAGGEYPSELWRDVSLVAEDKTAYAYKSKTASPPIRSLNDQGKLTTVHYTESLWEWVFPEGALSWWMMFFVRTTCCGWLLYFMCCVLELYQQLQSAVECNQPMLSGIISIH